MPKIFILMACEECDLCLYGYLNNDHSKDSSYFCIQSEKRIPDIGEIADFCELPDIPTLADREDIMKKWDNARKYIAEGGGGSWPRDFFESVLDHFYELLPNKEE